MVKSSFLRLSGNELATVLAKEEGNASRTATNAEGHQLLAKFVHHAG